MGGGGNTGQYQQANYQAGYDAYKQYGAQYGDAPHNFPQSHPEYAYFDAGWNAAKSEARASHSSSAAMAQMSQMFSSMMREMQQSQQRMAQMFQEQQDEAKKTAAQQAADAQRDADIGKRDALFKDYMDLAGTATAYINDQIEQERANAALMGVDYNITDDAKQSRISDYFTGLWGEGSQAELEALISKYGNPEGFDGTWLIARSQKPSTGGTGTAEKGFPKPTNSRTLATGGASPNSIPTLAEEDEEETLG